MEVLYLHINGNHIKKYQGVMQIRFNPTFFFKLDNLSVNSKSREKPYSAETETLMKFS